MPTFEWRGTRQGQTQTGVLTADSKAAAEAMLRRQRIEAPSIKEKGKELALPKWGGRVPPQLIAIFTRQFSVMVDAGLPLVQCLELLAKEEPDKRLAAAIDQVRVDVEAGSTLADAMQKRPYAFDHLFTNMIAAGEAGGILDVILQRLSTFIEKQAKLVGQVRSAMIYPISVLSIAAVIVTIIMVKVVPTFTDL